MANDKPSKATKRQLRPAETVRQKAEKAQTTADKPARGRRLKAAAATSRKPFARVGKIFDRQPFRFIGRILLPRFVRNAFAELKLVSWPDRTQTRRLTFAVLMFAIVFGAAITGVDYVLDKIFRALILN